MIAEGHPRASLATARAIARMWCPECPEPGAVARPVEQSFTIESDDTDGLYLIDTCTRNKVPLLSLPITMGMSNPHQYQPETLLWTTSASYRRAIEAERADWTNTRREYLMVQDLLHSEGIRAVLIKSVGLTPSLPYRSDNLDVLIDPQHDQSARRILLDSNYVEITNVEEPLKFLFRKFRVGESISAIHLHEAVGWGTGFMDDAAVLAAARPAPDDPQIWIPAPEDALLITMAHSFYEDKEIKLGDIWKIVHLLRENHLDWDRIERQAAGRGWIDGLDTCLLLWSSLEERLRDEHSFPRPIIERARQRVPAHTRSYLRQRLATEPTFPFSLSFRFSKRLYYAKVLNDAALPARQKAVDITRHTLAGLKRRLPTTTQPAMLITLSGVDGSGKTVHAQALYKALRQCEIDARVVWMRGGSSPLTDRIIHLVKPWLAPSRKRPDPQADSPANHQSFSSMKTHVVAPPPSHAPENPDLFSGTRQAKIVRKSTWLRRPLLRMGWVSMVTIDLILTCLRQVYWPLARGRVVICDRYVFDALVEMAALADDRQLLTGWAARILRLCCPRPRQAYLLDVSPQHAIARKPDEVADFLDQQCLLYRLAAPSWGLNTLDTNKDQEISTDLLVHKVLREYYRDWHTVVAALFWANPLKHNMDQGGTDARPSTH